MGRKRSLPARAREKAVVEEMMDAIEQEARKSSLQSKPDESLFIIDSQGMFMFLPAGSRSPYRV